MSDINEIVSNYFDSPGARVTLEDAITAADSYVQIVDSLAVDPEVHAVLIQGILEKMLRAFGGTAMALIYAEYAYPLHQLGHIPRNPSVATGTCVVIDTAVPLSVVPMPFKPDMMARVTEWTGVGFVARLADRADMHGIVRDLHQEHDLAPEIAIPLSNNFIEAAKLPSVA